MTYEEAARLLRNKSKDIDDYDLSLAMNLCAQAVSDLSSFQRGECPICGRKVSLSIYGEEQP